MEKKHKAKMEPDGSYKVVNICNANALNLRDEYERLTKEIEAKNRELEELEIRRRELRMEEVGNVIDYVRTYARLGKLNTNEIDCLLCHCQNMMHGNIDGTFITFKDPEEKE